MHATCKPLSRRAMLHQSLAAFAALALRANAEPAAAKVKPNVLFIAVDDLRPELKCFGRDWIKSPNIDALAATGMVFNRAYCQQAVCSPSRSSLMTGMRPDTTKVWDLKTHFRVALPNVKTLPEQFKASGYFAQGMGKIYHPSVEDPQTWSVAWQTPKAPVYALTDAGEPGDNEEAPQAKKAKDGHGPSAAFLFDDDVPMKKGKNGPAYEAGPVADDFYKDGKVAELAVKTLGELSRRNEPFFLAVGFAKPHLPFVSPKKYWDLYDEKTIQLAPNPFHPKDAPDYAVNGTSELRQYNGIPAEGPIPDEMARTLKHGYYAAVSYTDAQIGKVMAELDRLGLRKNTIVVFWGDHGWKLGEHGEWTKHTNVENDTNAPLIVSYPGMKHPGGKTDGLVEYVDIYPTLCELAGVPLPDHLEGVSFKPLMDNPALEWKKAAFSQYPRGKSRMGYTMRTKEYRLTVWVSTNDHAHVLAVELYDQRADPQENVNVAGHAENAELVKRLMEQWKAGWSAAKPGV